MNFNQIIEAIKKPSRPTITVAGDYCLDKYLYIDAKLDEPSVETGLTAYQVREQQLYPGVGGTIAANLRALGAAVRAVGVYGGDGNGFELINALNSLGIETQYMIRQPDRYTNTYMKPMRQIGLTSPNASGIGTGTSETLDAARRQTSADRYAWTELNRLDIRNREPVSESVVDQTLDQLSVALDGSRALIISDQFTFESGSVVSDRFRDRVSQLYKKYPDLFILVDSRSFVEKYQNVVVKCNADELIKAIRRLEGDRSAQTISADDSAARQTDRIERSALRLSERNGRSVVVTLGSRGCLIASSGTIEYIPAQVVEPPIDICGAGDATNAGLAFGAALGLSLPESAYLAGIVSSITIKQIGVTGTATVGQILDVLQSRIP